LKNNSLKTFKKGCFFYLEQPFLIYKIQTPPEDNQFFSRSFVKSLRMI